MADGAVGQQQQGIDVVGLAARDDLWRVYLDCGAMAAVGGRAVKAWRDAADAALDCGFAKGGKREIGAGVFRGGVRAVDGDVRDTQVVVAIGVAGVHRIEFRGGVVGCARALVAGICAIRCGRGDDGDTRLRQRLRQRCEGHVRVVREHVGRAIAETRVVVADAREIGDRCVVGIGEAEG